ncbi:MAG TPA: alpha/beta hydrolase [Candidatus Limnocylindria bacterium]|jgi:pimeloyl-ACP methyl ester carboxylesterase|nr:alpha/beta hydrolase [Candidatus Limnocylindria bacterium]
MTLAQTNIGTIQANGTELYYELRGRGPAVLFISGATGDAGHFSATAERLADEFKTIAYDRRGNSRSPRPAGWTTTTMAEQADDAAALVRALGVEPVVCFATSGGGDVGIELLLRDPDLLRGIILHEPALSAPIMTPEEAQAALAPIVGPAMASGGPRAVVEAFVRHFAGSENWDRLDPALRERMLGNAQTFLGAEVEPFLTYRPEPAALLASRVPLRIGLGTSSVRDAIGGAQWLADVLGLRPVTIPGGHAPYFEDSDRFARDLRPILRELAT